MDCIGVEEEGLDDREALHSFDPLDFPPNVSQSPLTDKEKEEIRETCDSEDMVRNLPRTRRYLPCHYFDQIGGSSFGA